MKCFWSWRAIRSKTYPLQEILEALTAYNLWSITNTQLAAANTAAAS